MTIFDGLTFIGGLCLFLFGMNQMGSALERGAGRKLQSVLGKLTTNRFVGFLTGLGITGVIQSSSATTVMVVGFVNSGLMTLKQAINVIMGANIGTTVTAWILSLGGIRGETIFVQLLKPTSFTPLLALVGIILYMFFKSDKKKNTGMILLGFAVLMFGMNAMTQAVVGLADVPEFRNLLLIFKNPLLGVLTGALLTAIIQSSSASVGILQVLSTTGAVTYAAAVPIIMGQNIGTCITALISSIGANRNAKRAALVHLFFNVIGTAVWFAVFSIINAAFKPALFNESASFVGIAIAHSAFNIACAVLLFPLSSVLEKIVVKIIPDKKRPDTVKQLDERLLINPSVALERSFAVSCEMAGCSVNSIKDALQCLKKHSPQLAKKIHDAEERTDQFEDMIGSYLVKLGSADMNSSDIAKTSVLLKVIGDFERIADHAVNILESAEEMQQKKISFSPDACAELDNLSEALNEILDFTYSAFIHSDAGTALKVEPLEQVIDELKEKMRNSHIVRLQKGVCSIETGFVWSDILTCIERVSDHCSNIAVCVFDAQQNDSLDLHEALKAVTHNSVYFKEQYSEFAHKYLQEKSCTDNEPH